MYGMTAVEPIRASRRPPWGDLRFFLGILLRLELELPSGLIIRSRMTKEEYSQLGLEDGREISFQIKNYRVLASEGAQLAPEVESRYQAPPTIAENI